MTKRILAGVVVCGWLLAAGSFQAHHSLAGTYDLKNRARNRRASESGVFESARSADDRDQECGGRGKIVDLDDRLHERPGKRRDLRHRPESAQGRDTIQVSFNPALNGSNLGFLRSIALPGTKEVEFKPI